MMHRTLVVLASALVSTVTLAQSERLTAVLSDLHLNEHADAEQDAALSGLLSALAARDVRGIDLLLNGDTFELAGCGALVDETAARAELGSIAEAHPSVFEALARFAAHQNRRVVFVSGECDQAIRAERVAASLTERLGSVVVATDARFTSDDGKVVVEHGDELFGTVPRLETAYREARSTFPLVASFAERLSGLEYALAADSGGGVSSEWLKRFLLNFSWQQFRRDLELEVMAPEWDLVAIRDLGDDFVLQSIPGDDPLVDAWQSHVQQGTFRLSELDDVEILAICDYRAALRRARRRMERGLSQLARVGPVVSECPRLDSSRGASFSYYWSRRDAFYNAYFEGLPQTPEVYVHGHTHLPDRGFVPGIGLDAPRILNSGAFMRTITPAAFEALKQSTGESTRVLVDRLRSTDLASCYGLVLIEPYDDTPVANHWFWFVAPESGEWEMARRCQQQLS